MRHRFVGAPARAEVGGDHLLDEDPQLHIPRLVDAELLADVGDLLGARDLAREHVCGIAADPVEQDEHQHDHPEHRRDHLPEPPDDVCVH